MFKNIGTKNKKELAFGLILLVVLVAELALPLKPLSAEEPVKTVKTTGGYKIKVTPEIKAFQAAQAEGKCEFSTSISFKACLNRGVAAMGYLFLRLVSYLLELSGWFFDTAVDISLIKTRALFTDPQGVVIQGWQLSRDVANMFLIFVIVFIGISIILQRSYGSQKIIVKIIIISLLINFSLPISRLIIDTSNVLAMEFVCKMTNDTCEATNLSTVILSKLQLQTIFGDKNPQTQEDLINKMDTTKIITITIFGSILIAIAAFVLFAAAIMFVMRTVAFLVLVMLGPLAFMSMAMPGKAGTLSSKWWNKLIDYSFFAPAFFFLLYFVLRLLDTNGVFSLTNTSASQGSFLSLAAGGWTATNVGLVMQFVIVIILFLYSITLAKSMGGEAASYGFKGANWARGKFKGYAGRISRRAAGGAGAGAFATGVAPKDAGRWQRAMATLGRGSRKVPVVGALATKGATAITEENTAKMAGIKKQFERLSANELKSIAASSIGFRRVAALQKLAEMKDLKPSGKFGTKEIESGVAVMGKYGIKTKDVTDFAWQYETNPAKLEEAFKKLPASSVPEMNLDKYFVAAPGMIGYDASANAANKTTREAMYKGFHSKHAQNIYERDDAASDRFFNNLKEDFKSANPRKPVSITELSGWIKTMGNNRLASWMDTPAGKNILEGYGFTTQKENSKSKDDRGPSPYTDSTT